MDWIQEKVWWVLGVFGTTTIGAAFGFGKLYQRVGHLEKQEKIIHDRIDKVKDDVEDIKENQLKSMGYLEAILEKLNN